MGLDIGSDCYLRFKTSRSISNRLSKIFSTPHYQLYIDENITEGTKTGSRVVYPLPFEWVELFDIPNPKTQYLDKHQDFFLANLHKFPDRFAERMRFKNVGFQPYDLRHRYAIRGRELGYKVDDLAKWMGHSLKEHTETYQRYWLIIPTS